MSGNVVFKINNLEAVNNERFEKMFEVVSNLTTRVNEQEILLKKLKAELDASNVKLDKNSELIRRLTMTVHPTKK